MLLCGTDPFVINIPNFASRNQSALLATSVVGCEDSAAQNLVPEPKEPMDTNSNMVRIRHGFKILIDILIQCSAGRAQRPLIEDIFTRNKFKYANKLVSKRQIEAYWPSCENFARQMHRSALTA